MAVVDDNDERIVADPRVGTGLLPTRIVLPISGQPWTVNPSPQPIWNPTRPVAPISGINQKNLLNAVQNKVIVPTTIIQSPVGTGGIPKQLIAVSATESPIKQQTNTMSEVSVSFTRDPSDSNFASVKIWFVGYQGSSTQWLMAQGSVSPVTFVCETTGETVTVLVQPVGTAGQSASTVFASECHVTLDGVVSAPPAPSVSQTVVPIVGGFQFTFNVEAGLLEDVISGYNIYRSTTNNQSAATKIDFVAQDPKNTGTYVYQDHCGGDTNEYYWVSAVNTSALESTLTACQTGTSLSGTTTNAYGLNALPNPSFDIDTIGTPLNTNLTPAVFTAVTDGWYIAQVDGHNYWECQLESDGDARTGNNDLLIRLAQGITIPSDDTAYGFRVFSSSLIPVSVGDFIRVSAFLRWDKDTSLPTNVDVIQRVGFYVYDSLGDNIGELNSDCLDGALGYGTWNNDTVTYEIPATLGGLAPAYVVVELCGFITNNSGSSFSTSTHTYADLRFDDGKVVTQQTAFGLSPISTSYSDNSMSSILSQSGTTTLIDVASFEIVYADGTKSYNSGSVDPGSYGTYFVYFSDPTYSGGSVTYLTTAAWSDMFSANGNVLIGSIKTSSSGGATGGGNGGTDNPCFMPDVKLFDGKPISEHKTGDYVLTKKGFRRIKEMHVNPYKGMLCNMGNDEWVTEKHAFIAGSSIKPADAFWTPTRYYEGDVWNLTIDTEEEDERNYFLANGMLSHNILQGCVYSQFLP